MNEPLNPEVLLHNAAAELPARERSTYWDQACGQDAALRRQVEAWLVAHADRRRRLRRGTKSSISASPRRRRGGDGFYRRLAAWFLEEPAKRAVSPF